MAGLTSAVHWWEESQMRVLVLSSLVVQFFLLIFTSLRNRAIPGWIRFIIWLAYLGGDAIAIYALAALFNRHKEQDQGGNGGSLSSTLEVVWAPILLIHLGGHDSMTAYNIEDNELWTRHLLTAVSQVTVAIYVFCKSWPQGGDKRLLQAAILLFIPGVIKCFTKPWALKRASIKSLVSAPSTERTAEQTKEGMKPLEDYVQRRAKASVRQQNDEGNQNEVEMDTVEGYVKGSMAFVREQKDEGGSITTMSTKANLQDSHHVPSQEGDDISSAQDHRSQSSAIEVPSQQRLDLNMILQGEAYKLFVDLSSPYPLRLSLFRCFWTLSEEIVEEAYGYVRQGLASAFILLYTKVKVSSFPRGADTNSDSLFAYLVVVSRGVLPWAAIGLFHHSRREAYSGIDVKITYALFCCTAVVEVYSQQVGRELWPQMVAQYNLIGYYARCKKHSYMMWIARKSGCRDFLDQHWCMESCFSSRIITELVLQYLKAGWKEKIQGPVSYHKFNDNRGQWALKGNEQLGWSIKGPFDESVLLWHIATDFCFFLSPYSEHIKACASAEVQSSQNILLEILRLMSNYMVYLLFVNPEMLLPGTRRYLFSTAYNELKNILGDNKMNLQSSCCRRRQQVVDKGLMETLIGTMRSNKQDPKMESKEGQPKGGSKGNFIDQAWELAMGLQNMGEEKMWKVIQGVWVEMLCFSASRCRGYLHAKALGSGGEFLSYIWLLQFYMGMETFTERLERGREVFRSHEENNSATQAPRASDANNGSDTASSYASSWIRSRATPSPSHLDTGASQSNEIRIAMD